MSNSILCLEPYTVFAEMPDVAEEWIWDGLISRGTCSILSGKPKDGKSTFVRHLIKAITDGSDFLNRKVTKTGIIYLAIEENRFYVKKIFSEIGMLPTESLLLHVGSFDVSNPDRLFKEIKETAEMYQCGLIIVDPLIKAVPGFDTNDYAKATQITQWFLDLARSAKAHVLLIHHTRKGESSGQESAMGSNGFSGGVDNTIVLENSPKFSTLSFRGRYIETQEVSFKRDGASLVKIDSSDKSSYISEAIIHALEKKSPQSREQMRTAIACRDQDLSKALNELIELNQVSVEGTGVRGSKRVYKLNSLLRGNLGEE